MRITNPALFCVAVFVLVSTAHASERNTKMGVSIATTQSCNSLAHHSRSSWWYSWSSQNNGFHGGRRGALCPPDVSTSAVGNARTAGMDFVPMFWGDVPSPDALDNETIANLKAADYVMGFNEPEIETQANLTAMQAAEFWPRLVSIAKTYNLSIVAPCSESGGKGRTWYSDWTAACTNLFGSPCEYDFTCIHMYYQPSPCKNDPNIESYACLQENAGAAVGTLNYWYNAYGKQIWVTEFACAPWGNSVDGCGVERQRQLMEQLTPVLDNSSQVFRYAWFTAYNNSDPKWVGASLNEPSWQASKRVGCQNRKWISGLRNIQGLNECLSIADTVGSSCAKPLSLSIDDDGCYCATDNCATLVSTWNAMVTYKEIPGMRDSSTLTPMGELYNSYGSPPPHCVVHQDCSDGVFCNGAEICMEGSCVEGSRPCLSAGESCNEDTDTCDLICDNNGICNGGEDMENCPNDCTPSLPTPLPTTTSTTTSSRPTPPTTPTSTPFSCFSGVNTVMVQGKGRLTVDALEIGDYVQTDASNPESFSRIYTFMHRDPVYRTDYVQIYHDKSTQPLEISSEHMLAAGAAVTANGKPAIRFVRAGHVRVGDWIRVIVDSKVRSGSTLPLPSKGTTTTTTSAAANVTSIRLVSRAGLYAPVTEQGTIVVSRVESSCYISLLDPSIPDSLQHYGTHIAFGVKRMMCQMTGDCQKHKDTNHHGGGETYDQGGLSEYTAFLGGIFFHVADMTTFYQKITIVAMVPIFVAVMAVEFLFFYTTISCSFILVVSAFLYQVYYCERLRSRKLPEWN